MSSKVTLQAVYLLLNFDSGDYVQARVLIEPIHNLYFKLAIAPVYTKWWARLFSNKIVTKLNLWKLWVRTMATLIQLYRDNIEPNMFVNDAIYVERGNIETIEVTNSVAEQYSENLWDAINFLVSHSEGTSNIEVGIP